MITEQEARDAAAFLDKAYAIYSELEDYDERLSGTLREIDIYEDKLISFARQQLARHESEKPERVNYWLAERNQYGNADVFIDGPHSNREGVEKALYLINSLGLNLSTKNRDLCCIRVEQTPVEPKNHNANEEAIAACREMMK